MKKQKYVTENFPTDILIAILRDDIPDSWTGTDEEFENNYKEIRSKIVDQSRWFTYYDMIFSANGKLYKTTYKRGSTEQQYVDNPFEDEEFDGVVDCIEVEEKEVIVKQYVEKMTDG